jgi:hypothetical protein
MEIDQRKTTTANSIFSKTSDLQPTRKSDFESETRLIRMFAS